MGVEDSLMGMYEVTVTFFDGVSVPTNCASLDEGYVLYDRYVKDAQAHRTDGYKYTAKSITLTLGSQTVRSWSEDDE